MFDSTMKQFHSITKFFITVVQVFSRCDTKWWICKILYLQWMQLKWEDLDFSVLLNCCRFLAWLFTKCEIPKFSVATIVVTKRISKIPQTLDQDIFHLPPIIWWVDSKGNYILAENKFHNTKYFNKN